MWCFYKNIRKGLENQAFLLNITAPKLSIAF